MYDINITIVNWMSKDDIDKCLNSLFKDFNKEELDVIVHIVDNSNNQDNIKNLISPKYWIQK